MQVETISDWNANSKKEWIVGCGKYVGIAIGMGSEEGVVKVNGFHLASGRVLPLPTESGYRIEHALGTGVADYFAATAPAQLELYLFESRDELAVNVGRAKR